MLFSEDCSVFVGQIGRDIGQSDQLGAGEPISEQWDEWAVDSDYRVEKQPIEEKWKKETAEGRAREHLGTPGGYQIGLRGSCKQTLKEKG